VDFQNTLTTFNLPLASLEPHLHPPIAAEKLRVVLEESPLVDLPTSTGDFSLGPELSGDVDKKSKLYIPSNFPPFPSKHTYKWTEKASARETDPRKIREEAAKTARQGEEALRRLTKVAKAGKEKDVKNAARKDPKSYARHNMWEQAMEDLLSGKGDATTKHVTQEDDRGLVVNADRSFYRKGPPPKRRPPVEGI
jgi:transcription initiation factor TFIID subunit 8